MGLEQLSTNTLRFAIRNWYDQFCMWYQVWPLFETVDDVQRVDTSAEHGLRVEILKLIKVNEDLARRIELLEDERVNRPQ